MIVSFLIFVIYNLLWFNYYFHLFLYIVVLSALTFTATTIKRPPLSTVHIISSWSYSNMLLVLPCIQRYARYFLDFFFLIFLVCSHYVSMNWHLVDLYWFIYYMYCICCIQIHKSICLYPNINIKYIYTCIHLPVSSVFPELLLGILAARTFSRDVFPHPVTEKMRWSCKWRVTVRYIWEANKQTL